MVEHKMYCTLAAKLSKDWSKMKIPKCFGAVVLVTASMFAAPDWTAWHKAA